MSDLADRISRAAVAALDLAPFDDRYSRLSRQVLTGGASRFAPVTADDQATHFVIPVGVAGERLQYGALVLQDRQAGIVWRDADGTDHTRTVERGGARTSFSSLTLGGEQWMRFDIDGDDGQLAFLVPPVNSPLLRSTLIDFFRARPGTFRPEGAVPLIDPEPEPRVRFPDPEPEPEPADETPADDLEPTELMSAVEMPEPALINEWGPEASQPADETVDDATRVHEPSFDLYRDAPSAPPAWTQQHTQALAAQPPAAVWQPASAPVAPDELPAQHQPSNTSRTLVGFLLGLFGTLAVGGAIIIVQLLTA